MSLGDLTYREWLEDTAVPMKPRSAALKKIDRAIDAYEQPGGATAFNKLQIGYALEDWKKTQGGGAAWKSSARNTRKRAVEKLDDIISGKTPATNPYLQSLQDGRLGLLYVFAGMDVDAKLFNLVLESALDTSSAVFGFDPVTAKVGNLPGQIVSAGQKVKTAMDAGLDHLDKKSDLKARFAQGPSALAKPSLTAPAPPPVTGALRLSTGLTSCRQVEAQPPALPSRFDELVRKIKDKLHEYATMAWQAIRKKFDEALDSPFDAIGEWGARIATVVNFLAGHLAAKAAPFISAGIDIALGICETIGAIAKRYEVYIAGVGVTLNPGHPKAVEDAIKTILNVGIGNGLWSTLKGGAALGLDFVGGAAGAIFSMIVTLCEVLGKFIYRLWDASRIKSFCAKCKERYERNKAARQSGQPGDLGNAGEFGNFLRSYFLTSPSLACLTIMSGYAGDSMQWLNMNSTYNKLKSLSDVEWNNNGGRALVQEMAKDVQTGAAYLTKLKEIARDFIKNSSYSFSHTDASLNNILFSDQSYNPNFGFFAKDASGKIREVQPR